MGPLLLSITAVAAVAAFGAGGAGAARLAVGPSNTTLPSVTGTAQAGSTLTASPGVWSGDLPISFQYQWQRCDATCTDIPGATSVTYPVTAADVTHKLRVVVKASNAGGVDSANSAQTATVTAAPVPPSNTAVPTISGSAASGQNLTAANGTWSGDPTITFTYQWQRCDGAGANCGDISTATASTFGLTAADVGHTLRVGVTGTNGAGHATAYSATTAVVTAAPGGPVNTALPAITGSTVVGQTLTASSGTWTGNATITFAYSWQRCDGAGSNCGDIPLATSSTFQLTGADLGHTLRVKVTGTNGVGSASAVSAATAVVTGAPVGAPKNVVPPFVGGYPQVGQTLTGTTGSWAGTAPLTFVFEWQRCDQFGQGCQAISGASNATYVLVNDDAGHRIVLHVKATNSVGSADAFSRPTGVVQGAPGNPGQGQLPTKQACKHHGWRLFGFRNQGQCIKASRWGNGRGHGGDGGDDDHGGSGKVSVNTGVQIGGSSIGGNLNGSNNGSNGNSWNKGNNGNNGNGHSDEGRGRGGDH